MAEAVLDSRDPSKVRAGRIGARARWGDTPRVVRLDSLDPFARDAVLALIRLDEAKRARDGAQEAA
jgi:hypothetical protein